MTGWNLPPGCEVSDLPGSRPIDIDWDHFWENYDFKTNLKEWAKENNKMLHSVLGIMENTISRTDYDIIIGEIVRENEDDLPIEKLFDDWIKEVREDQEEPPKKKSIECAVCGKRSAIVRKMTEVVEIRCDNVDCANKGKRFAYVVDDEHEY